MPEHEPFVDEQHMIRYFANNLSAFEPNLIRCTNSSLQTSEYWIPTYYIESRARIDILAADCRGGLVIIECKLKDASHHVVGQVAAYVTALKRHMASGSKLRLRAFIVCRNARPLLWYAIRCLKGIKVEVFTYDDQMRVRRLKSPLTSKAKRA
jgi:RecB family endonuclease NucS